MTFFKIQFLPAMGNPEPYLDELVDFAKELLDVVGDGEVHGAASGKVMGGVVRGWRRRRKREGVPVSAYFHAPVPR